MVLKYLKKLEENPTIYERTIRGISESEIAAYEAQLGIKFPLAYKEFLYLAGDYPGDLTLFEGNSGIKELANPGWIKHFQKHYIEYFKIKIDRPFWVFTQGSQGFLFFYLDENIEDPIIWSVDIDSINKYELSKGEVEETFSEYINDLIDYSYKYYKEIYG